jgi:hypothetical protein
MIKDPKALMRAFLRAARISAEDAGICHESVRAPHKPPPKLPKGKCAVYVFSLATAHGRTCRAGPRRVLKVGKVGPNSHARFSHQHYKVGSARSTLADSLTTFRVLWPYLGIKDLPVDDAGKWLQANTDRDHFFVDAGKPDLLSQLEVYLKGILGPVFEGSLGSQGKKIKAGGMV